MYSYLISFHLNSGICYQTVLLGSNLDEVINIVSEKLERKERLNVFEMKDKKNVSFSVIVENVACIEFEFLSSEPIIEFDKLYTLSDDVLKTVLEHFKNDYVIAVSLLYAEENIKTKFFNCLSSSRTKNVNDILKLGLGKIKGNDVTQAQLEVIETVTELHQNNIIKI